MKEILKKVGFAGAVIMAGASVPALAATAGAAGGVSNAGLCGLIQQMYGVFTILRTLAFVGAAFIIAGWAWGYISKPDSMKLEDLKTKGTGMLVGFVLLFGIGVVLSFFLTSTGLGLIGCEGIITSWGKM